MNQRQTELYNNLMKLVDGEGTFFFADHELDKTTYRIFSYHIASYSEFLQPDALECRGHMFEMENGVPTRLASLPMSKFFNFAENLLTMDLDLTNPEFIVEKLDGSLISSFIHSNGTLRLKSKGSLSSEQAMASMRLIESNGYVEFLAGVSELANDNLTVIMEYTAPDNRIVLGYSEPKLTVLGVRNNETFEYIPWNYLNESPYCQWMQNNIAEDFTLKYSSSMDTFIDDVRNMLHIEGFIVGLSSGQRIKIKTDEYVSLHRTKDSVNSPRRLYECVINGGSDDLKSMFADDGMAVQMINDMEVLVQREFNNVVKSVNTYFDNNKTLSRKDYAIKGQSELSKPLFGLAMQRYVGNEIDYKEFMVKHYKSFGIADDL